jgi:hypothetical protein
VRPHLVGADAWGKSAGRITDAIEKRRGTTQKPLSANGFFSPVER